MYAILRITAVFVLVVTTTTSIEVQKFTEKAYKALGLIKDPKVKITAQLINPDHDVYLQRRQNLKNDAATFMLDSKNELNKNVAFGIKINNGKEVFFDLSAFSIVTSKVSNDKGTCVRIPCVHISEKPVSTSTSIVLRLKPHDTDPIMLEIPVFITPKEKHSDFEYTRPFYWKRWAAEQRVGIITPRFQYALENSCFTGMISFDFIWLAELLSYNIYEHKHQHYEHRERFTAYVTRPLVVSRRTKNALKSIVKASKRTFRTADIFSG